MSNRIGGAVLLVVGGVLGVVAALLAFKPIVNELDQPCGSVFAPAAAPPYSEDDFIDDFMFPEACRDAMASSTVWAWILVVAAVIAIIVAVVLIARPATTATAGLAPKANATPDVADQLRKLQSLHADGALSDDEFAAAKARVLKADVPAGRKP